jgi:hypothetical protein
MLPFRSNEQSSLILLLWLVVSISLFLPIHAMATPFATAKELMAFKVKNDTRDTATDFHIRFDSTNNFNLVGADAPAFGDFLVNRFGNADVGIDFFAKAAFNRVAVGESATIRIEVTPTDPMVMQQTYDIRSAFWTKDFSLVNGVYRATSIGDAKLPGFAVFKDPSYTILNDLSDPISVQGLQFFVNVPEMSIDNLLSLTPTSGLNFTLSPNSSTRLWPFFVAPAQVTASNCLRNRGGGKLDRVRGHETPDITPR